MSIEGIVDIFQSSASAAFIRAYNLSLGKSDGNIFLALPSPLGQGAQISAMPPGANQAKWNQMPSPNPEPEEQAYHSLKPIFVPGTAGKATSFFL